MNKVPKKANKAISLLEDLVEKLHFFYGDHENFRNDVLKPASEIEDILKELAVNKKETFKRISKKYEEYYRQKQEAIDITVTKASEQDINERMADRYKEITDV